MAISGASSGSNRTITRFVLGFAAASLAASCLPLLKSASGEPLIQGLARADAFVVYGLLIAALPVLVLPVGFAVSPGKTLTPLAPLFALALTFASLPMVVAAWISGVDWTGVAGVGASALALGGVLLHMRRWMGVRAAVPAGAIGAFTVIALPALSVLLASLGKSVPNWWGWISPPTLCLGASVTHAVDGAGWYVLAAVVIWIPLLVQRRVAAVLMLPLALGSPLALGVRNVETDVTFASLGGPWSWPQVPTPVLVTNPGDQALLRLRGESHALAPQSSNVLWLAAEGGETAATIERKGSAAKSLALPFAAPPVGAAVVACLRGSTLVPESRPSSASEIDLLEFSSRGLVPSHLDAIVLGPSDNLTPKEAEVIHAAAALGVKVVVWGGPAIEGISARIVPVTSPASEFIRVHASVDDGTIRTLFAAPDWQAIDLTRLLVFLVAYHIAFGLAFMLPVSLDSKKSPKVYLISVGFIVVATALGGRATLKTFFLTDTQVYTQSLTLVTVSEAGHCAMRQIRSYASMSGEVRDLRVPPGGNVVCYRSLGRPAPLRRRSPEVDGFVDVALDRVDGKVLLRDDRAGRSPLRIEAEGANRFRIRLVDGVDDPFGLRGAVPIEAALVLPDGGLVPLHVQGRELAPAVAAEGFTIDAATRALLGRFALPIAPEKGAILIRLLGTTRPDPIGEFFEVQDRGAIVLAPLP